MKNICLHFRYFLKSKFAPSEIIYSHCVHRSLTLYLPLQLEKNALGEWFSSVLLSSLHFREKSGNLLTKEKRLKSQLKTHKVFIKLHINFMDGASFEA